jgi:hypothetical protein
MYRPRAVVPQSTKGGGPVAFAAAARSDALPARRRLPPISERWGRGAAQASLPLAAPASIHPLAIAATAGGASPVPNLYCEPRSAGEAPSVSLASPREWM